MIPALYPNLTWSDLFSFLSIGRPINLEFEKKLTLKFGIKHAVTYSSGRAGLYHILKAHNLHKKNVLITAYTCCVVTEAIVQSDNLPVFIDTSAGSFNSEILESYLDNNTGAIVITNIYGLTSSYEKLIFLARRKNIIVIIDDALTPGDIPKAPKDIYDYVYTSCAVRKPFTGLGGGVVFTNDDKQYQLLKAYTNSQRKKLNIFIQSKKFIFSSLFFLVFRPFLFSFTSLMRRKTSLLDSFFSEMNNDIYLLNQDYFFDMCDFQKRIANNQLKKIDRLLDERRKNSNLYFKLLNDHFEWIQYYWPKDIAFSHVPFLHPKRDELEKYLLKNGVDVERYFDYVIPNIDQYNNKDSYPNAEKIAKEILNLPMHVYLTEKHIRKITQLILEFDQKNPNKQSK
jgi:dTDP-4-amino-4,6-dideoxygalactose transaminase